MATETRRSKKRKVVAPSKGDDWLLRFLRQHSLGVMLLALFSAGGGWLVWHSRDCITDQKAQLAVTKKAWMNFRIANQKWMDDVDTFVTRIDIYERDEGSGNRYTLEQNRRAVFELGQIMSTHCNEVKAANYEWERQAKDLSRLFPFFVPHKMTDDPESCGKILREAERLRFFDAGAGNSVLQGADSDANLAELKAINVATRKEELETDRAAEAFFVRLENMSFVGRLKQCF